MRIAVCLSGQLRKWELAYHNQMWFWKTANRPNVQVDYFAHTWTYSWDREAISKPYIERIVTKEEFLKFANIYKFKDAVYDSKPQDYFYGNDHWSGLFYSLAKSIMLKREYEIKNNFKYDIVVKSRPDVVFNPARTFFVPPAEDGIIFSTHGGTMPMEFNMYNFNDCVFLGNSYTMDLLIDLYFYRQKLIRESDNKENNVHPMGPGTLMHEYFRDYGITPIFNLGFFETLLKEGCPENLDLLNDEEFMEMDRYFKNWYNR